MFKNSSLSYAANVANWFSFYENCFCLATSRSLRSLAFFSCSNFSLSLASLSLYSNALFARTASISSYLLLAFSYWSLSFYVSLSFSSFNRFASICCSYSCYCFSWLYLKILSSSSFSSRIFFSFMANDIWLLVSTSMSIFAAFACLTRAYSSSAFYMARAYCFIKTFSLSFNSYSLIRIWYLSEI